MIPGSDGLAVGSVLPFLVVVLPTVAALVVYRSSRSRVRGVVSLGTTGLTFALLGWMVIDAGTNRIHRFDGPQIAPNVPIELGGDTVGLLFAVTTAGVYSLTVPYAIHRLRRGRIDGERRILACLMASQAVALGAALANNLLILFVFLELLVLTTYPLIAHAEDDGARRAGYAYLAYGFTGGLLVLIGTRLMYLKADTISFVDGGLAHIGAAAVSNSVTLHLALILFVLGFAIKAAVVPFHSWFVHAKTADTPIYGSVFAVVVLNAGMLGIVRVVVDPFGTAPVATALLLVLGMVTIGVAGTMSLGMERGRERFAYLAIASGGVPLVGLGGLSGEGRWMVLAFIPLYSVGLLAGFLACADLERSRSTWDRQPNPLTMIVLGLAAMWLVSVIGLAAIGVVWQLLSITPAIVWVPATVSLVYVTFVHAIGLWPAIRGLRSHRSIPVDAIDVDRFTTITGWGPFDRAVNDCYRVMTAGGRWGSRIASAAMEAVRNPDTTLERTIPTRLRPWYTRRRRRTPGLTGAKLTMDGSIYVIVVALTIALILGLR